MEHNEFSVELSILRGTVSELRESLDQLLHTTDQLGNSMETLNTQWSGPANMAFRASFAHDCSVTRDLCAELRKKINGIENAHDTYKECEEKVMDRVRSIQI